MTMGDTYPGFEKDINDGSPQTLRKIEAALDEGIDLARGAGWQSAGGQLSEHIVNREVFATLRDERDVSYWVTGVRLLPYEEGVASLAGAIELILEDGNDAQVRAMDLQLRKQIGFAVDSIARQLAITAKGGSLGVTTIEVEAFMPMARGIVLGHRDALNLPPEAMTYLR